MRRQTLVKRRLNSRTLLTGRVNEGTCIHTSQHHASSWVVWRNGFITMRLADQGELCYRGPQGHGEEQFRCEPAACTGRKQADSLLSCSKRSTARWTRESIIHLGTHETTTPVLHLIWDSPVQETRQWTGVSSAEGHQAGAGGTAPWEAERPCFHVAWILLAGHGKLYSAEIKGL